MSTFYLFNYKIAIFCHNSLLQKQQWKIDKASDVYFLKNWKQNFFGFALLFLSFYSSVTSIGFTQLNNVFVSLYFYSKLELSFKLNSLGNPSLYAASRLELEGQRLWLCFKGSMKL